MLNNVNIFYTDSFISLYFIYFEMDRICERIVNIWILILSKSDNYLADGTLDIILQIFMNSNSNSDNGFLKSIEIQMMHYLLQIRSSYIPNDTYKVSKVHQISVRFKSAHTYIYFISAWM